MTLITPSPARSLATVLILLLMVVLAGCTDDPTSADPADAPGVGSTFLFAGHINDPAGNPMEASRDTFTITLTEIHDEFKGRSNVYEFVGKTGTTYLTYESDGDVFVMLFATMNGVTDSLWIEAPIGSGDDVQESLIVRDDVVAPDVINRVSWSYISSRGVAQDFDIAGTTHTAQRADVGVIGTTSYIVDDEPMSELKMGMEVTIYLVPELGYIARQDAMVTDGDGNPAGMGNTLTLLSYDLK